MNKSSNKVNETDNIDFPEGGEEPLLFQSSCKTILMSAHSIRRCNSRTPQVRFQLLRLYQRCECKLKIINSYNNQYDHGSKERTDTETHESFMEPRRFDLFKIYNKKRDKIKPFEDNTISTSKYNVLTFFPKNLFTQFSKMSNVYFLFMAMLEVPFLPNYLVNPPYL